MANDDTGKWLHLWTEMLDGGVLKKNKEPVKPPKMVVPPHLKSQYCTQKYWSILKAGGKISDLFESEKPTANDVMKVMKNTPMPIMPSSVGQDQDPNNIGYTYSPEDILKLADLKSSLHELEDKLGVARIIGGNMTKFETQITGLQKQIGELSDALNRELKND